MQKERKSNIELLRIVCMLMIIAHHYVVHGGAIGIQEHTLNRVIALAILPAGKICFNCFVAISTWFLVNSQFKADKFIKVWLQVLFYNLVILGVAQIIDASEISYKQWIGAIFPIIGNSHGYAAAYLAFYLIIPFLSIIKDKIGKRQLQLLIFALIITQLGTAALGPFIGYTQPMQSEILLFVLCYFISLYIQRYILYIKNAKRLLASILFISWMTISVCRIYSGHIFTDYVANNLAGSEMSFINIIAGYCLFFLFYDLKIPYSKTINTMASTTFGILLFHDHNYFRSILWKNIIDAPRFYYVTTHEFLASTVCITITVFIVGILIESTRKILFEKIIYTSSIFKKLVWKLDIMTTSEKNPQRKIEQSKPRKYCSSTKDLFNLPSKGTLFSIIVLAALFLYVVVSYFTRGKFIDSYFVTDHTNTGMDYFNMLSNITHGDPYYAEANYPAFNFVLFRLAFRFSSFWIKEQQINGFSMRENMTVQLPFLILMFSSILIIWELLKRMSGESYVKSCLFAASMVFSGPMLFLYERGNVLLITLIFLLMFLLLYDSSSRRLRILSYICLALAAAMKLYPAAFGLLVLRKKRYKETAILVVMGVAALVIPFFFPFPEFGGVGGIQTMIRGFAASADAQLGQGLGCNFSFDNLYKIVGVLFGITVKETPALFKIMAILFCFLVFFVSKDEWKQLYSMTLLMVWVPDFSYTYSLVLLFLPIISFLYRNNSTNSKFNCIYVFLFAFMMIPYFLPTIKRVENVLNLQECKYPLSYGMLIINLALVVMAVLIIIEAIQNKQKRYL